MTPPRPWWTDADAAELDVLIFELVYGLLGHRTGCALCASRAPCPEVTDAIQAVVEWAYERDDQSRAEYLRAEFRIVEAPE